MENNKYNLEFFKELESKINKDKLNIQDWRASNQKDLLELPHIKRKADRYKKIEEQSHNINPADIRLNIKYIIFDIEVYAFGWSIVLYPLQSKKIGEFDKSKITYIEDDYNALDSYMEKHNDHVMVGFNSNNYDKPILYALLSTNERASVDNQRLNPFMLSQYIINFPNWFIDKELKGNLDTASRNKLKFNLKDRIGYWSLHMGVSDLYGLKKSTYTAQEIKDRFVEWYKQTWGHIDKRCLEVAKQNNNELPQEYAMLYKARTSEASNFMNVISGNSFRNKIKEIYKFGYDENGDIDKNDTSSYDIITFDLLNAPSFSKKDGSNSLKTINAWLGGDIRTINSESSGSITFDRIEPLTEEEKSYNKSYNINDVKQTVLIAQKELNWLNSLISSWEIAYSAVEAEYFNPETKYRFIRTTDITSGNSEKWGFSKKDLSKIKGVVIESKRNDSDFYSYNIQPVLVTPTDILGVSSINWSTARLTGTTISLYNSRTNTRADNSIYNKIVKTQHESQILEYTYNEKMLKGLYKLLSNDKQLNVYKKALSHFIDIDENDNWKLKTNTYTEWERALSGGEISSEGLINDNLKYKLGRGGIHGALKNVIIKLITLTDITSCHPNTVIKNNYFPSHVVTSIYKAFLDESTRLKIEVIPKYKDAVKYYESSEDAISHDLYKSYIENDGLTDKEARDKLNSEDVINSINEINNLIDNNSLSELVTQLLAYIIKRAGLKLNVNAGFGATGDRNNPAYNLQTMLNITITSQLQLLALSFALDDYTEMINVNTDGIIYKITDDKYSQNVKDIIKEWEVITQLSMESDLYHSIIQNNVNNYILMKNENTLGKCIGKEFKYGLKPGTPTNNVISNNDNVIVNLAVIKQLVFGTPVEKTIKEEEELWKFMQTTSSGKKFDILTQYKITNRIAEKGEILNPRLVYKGRVLEEVSRSKQSVIRVFAVNDGYFYKKQKLDNGEYLVLGDICSLPEHQISQEGSKTKKIHDDSQTECNFIKAELAGSAISNAPKSAFMFNGDITSMKTKDSWPEGIRDELDYQHYIRMAHRQLKDYAVKPTLEFIYSWHNVAKDLVDYTKEMRENWLS